MSELGAFTKRLAVVIAGALASIALLAASPGGGSLVDLNGGSRSVGEPKAVEGRVLGAPVGEELVTASPAAGLRTRTASVESRTLGIDQTVVEESTAPLLTADPLADEFTAPVGDSEDQVANDDLSSDVRVAAAAEPQYEVRSNSQPARSNAQTANAPAAPSNRGDTGATAAPTQATIRPEDQVQVAPTTTTQPPAASPTPTAPESTTTTTTSPPQTTTTTSPPQTTTTTSPPPPPLARANVPAGNAGPSGSQGCQGECPQVGFQNLDGQNGVVLENVTISNPNGRCISLNNAHNITIRNVTITNCGTNQAVWDHYDAGMVQIENSSNITIENSLISNISAGRFSAARNNAIQTENSHDLRFRNNTFRDIHSDIGQRANDQGNRAVSIQGSNTWNVTIDHNHFYNAGRNAIQVKDVRNAGGINLTNNIVEGRGPWNSDYEDMINLFSSSGTSGSPIRIAGNYLRNGGPSSNGTAIIVGDGTNARGATQFVLVEDNLIVDPGNVGINLAGGDHATVRNNVIYSTTDVRFFESVGFIINHFQYSPHCFNHTINGNRVWFRNQQHRHGVNHLWNTNSCGVNMFDNVWGDESLHGLFG